MRFPLLRILTLFLLLSAMPVFAGSKVALEDVEIKKGMSESIKLDSLSGEISVEVAGSFSGNRPVVGVGDGEWGLLFDCGDNDRQIKVAVKWGNENFGDAFDRRFLQISVEEIDNRGVSTGELASANLYDDVNLYGGENVLSVRFSNINEMQIWVGEESLVYAAECNVDAMPLSFRVFSNSTLKVNYVAVKETIDRALMLETNWSAGTVMDYLDNREQTPSGKLSPVGIWRFLDRENDPQWAVPGGTYELAVVEDDSGGYLVIYLSGAKTLASRWREGMMKGKMKETKFPGNYDLEWYDAEMMSMGPECYAEMNGNDLLSFRFPLFRSLMRFVRVK